MLIDRQTYTDRKADEKGDRRRCPHFAADTVGWWQKVSKKKKQEREYKKDLLT